MTQALELIEENDAGALVCESGTGQTPLMLALSKSLAPPLLILLKHTDLRAPLAKDSWGFTCFTYAIKQNFVAALLLMVAKGLKMERAYGDTNECGYAQWAAFCDRQFVLGMLVAQGHDFLRPDKLEQTPWDHAVENWSLLSIKLLLDFSDRPLKTCYFLHGSTRFQALQLVPDNPRTPADRLESRHIPGRLAHIGRVRRRVYDSVWQTLAQPDPIAALRDGFCYTWYRDNLAQGYWWRVYIFAVQALVCHVLVLAFTCGDHGAFPAVYLLAAALLAGANLLLAFKFGTSR